MYRDLELLQNKIKKEENKKYDMLVNGLLKSSVAAKIKSMKKEEIALLVKLIETVLPQMYDSMAAKDEMKNKEDIRIDNYTKISDINAMDDPLADKKTDIVTDDDPFNLNNLKLTYDGY